MARRNDTKAPAVRKAEVRPPAPRFRAAAPKPEPALDRALNAHNLNLAKLAATEASRFTINAMHVSETHTTVTDGHQLTRVDLAKQPVDSAPSITGMKLQRKWKPFLLPADTALEAAKALPKKPLLPACSVAWVGEDADDKTLRIGVTDLEKPRILQARKPQGNFPDYERVMPKVDTADYQIVLDANLLGRVLDYARKFALDAKGQAPVKLSFWKHRKNTVQPEKYGKWQPLAITVEADNRDTGQHMLSVVMPLADVANAQVANFPGTEPQRLPNKPVVVVPAPAARPPARVISHGTAIHDPEPEPKPAARKQASAGAAPPAAPMRKPRPAAPPPASKQAPARKQAAAAPRGGRELFGQPVAAALRWMGYNGFTSGEATAALQHFGLDVYPTTIRDNIGAGRADSPRFDESRMAKFTRDQAAQLLAFRAGGKAPAKQARVSPSSASASLRRRAR